MTTEPSIASHAQVTIIVDNQASKPGLIEEHGFAAWIETPETRLLLDSGQGTALMPNAASLGVPIEEAGALCLSHGHYDHTGGINALLDMAPDIPLYLHPNALLPRYRPLESPPNKSIGMPASIAEALKAQPQRLHPIEGPVWVGTGLLLTGPIPRFEPSDAGKGFYTDADCTIPDPLTDDQALLVFTPNGVSLVTGCCHAGIVNTLKYAARLAGVSQFEKVIGGFHLLHASRFEVDAAINAFDRYQVRRIAPCHCTGETATRRIGDHFGPRCIPCKAGQRIPL